MRRRRKMPKWGDILHIYVKDEKEKEEIKKIAKKLGVSVSELVRAFFRALAEGSRNIIINYAENQVNIGEIKISIQQQNMIQINNNIIAFLCMKIQDLIETAEKALKSRSLITYNNALVHIRDQLKTLQKELKALSPRGH